VYPKGLTAEEERNLARRIRENEEAARCAVSGIQVADEILRQRPRRSERTHAGSVGRLEQAVAAVELAARDDSELLEAARDARRALSTAEDFRWQLALSGIRIARGEARKRAGLLGEEDLRQEGIIGLLGAAKRFDPDRGFRFSTYCRWWVVAAMTRAMDTTGRMIRIPGYATEQIRHVIKAIRVLECAGVDWDAAILAAEVELPNDRIEFLLELIEGGYISLEHEYEEGMRFGDELESDGESPDDAVDGSRRLAWLRSQLNGEHVLNEREELILIRHYGLDGRPPKTMADIARHMGLSRERVRQIEAGALVRLRSNTAPEAHDDP